MCRGVAQPGRAHGSGPWGRWFKSSHPDHVFSISWPSLRIGHSMLQEFVCVACLLSFIIAYVCGSIPTGELIGRRLGIAVRETGSGNIGATNLARTAGKTAGILTLVGDVAKGLIPVLAVGLLGLGETVQAATAVAVVVGHMFSIFLGFSGGKGIATGFGALLGLAPLATLLALVAFIIIFAASRIVSLASVATALITPPLLAVLAYPRPSLLAVSLLVLLIIVRHRDNMRRLWKGQEAPFRLSSSTKETAHKKTDSCA